MSDQAKPVAVNREWRSQAACLGEDPSIFHRVSAWDPGVEGFTEGERRALETSNFARAQALCDACPVRLECGEEGAKSVASYAGESFAPGLVFSVWGGEMPFGWKRRNPGRPKAERVARPENMCPRGHVDRMAMQGGELRCRECGRLRDAKYRADGRKGVPRKPRLTLEELHADNAKGHAFEPAAKAKGVRCKACRREWLARSKASVIE